MPDYDLSRAIVVVLLQLSLLFSIWASTVAIRSLYIYLKDEKDVGDNHKTRRRNAWKLDNLQKKYQVTDGGQS